MRYLFTIVLLLVGCSTSPPLNVNASHELIGDWELLTIEQGPGEIDIHRIVFRENGTAVFGDTTVGYQIAPPYILLWGLADQEYKAPSAMYFEIEDSKFRLVTDVGIFLYTKQATRD